MKLSKYISGLLMAGILGSCISKFDEINTDPDSTTRVNSELLATGAIMGIMSTSQGKNFVSHMLVSKQIAWWEMLEQSTQYNNFGRDDFSGYTNLRNCQLMVQYAEDDNLPEEEINAYRAMELFMKAYTLFNYTISVGDIPYDGILQGAEGQFSVAYNTQKEVFQHLIEDLDNAHEYFQAANGTNFGGDPIFGGDTQKWNRVSNMLELRVLSMLSKKESDSDLNVATKYAEVVNRGMLLQSNDDNLQLVFSNKEGQLYPFNETLHSYKQYAMVSTTVIDPLKAYKDIRMFYYANPAQSKLDEGLTASDWGAYVGTDPSDMFEDITARSTNGEYCMLNERYSAADNEEGEPFIRIGYAEQCFNLAEAALRGWINGSASDYYLAGIEASLRFVGDHTPNEERFHHGHPITKDAISEILLNPDIQLTGDFEGDLRKIMEQKYLASFMHIPYLAYYDYRRTGYPEFPINPESNRNSYEPDKMPMRWMYPQREYDYNKENVNAAVQRQYGGSDDINQLMWIVQ